MLQLRQTLALSCFACLVLSPALHAQEAPRQPQPRKVLEALDLDHDGTLSAAEIKAAASSLLKLDTNGDGVLTSDELTGRPQNAGASSDELLQQLMAYDKTGKGYLVPADLPERMQKLFLRADTDHDGKLTPAEIRAVSARQSMPVGTAVAPGKASGAFRLDPILNALDLNHDGMLSAEEIASAPTSLLTLDKNGDGQITPDEMKVRQQTPQERVDHLFEEYDTNQDGKLTRTELPDRMAAQFDQIDLNHDGFLDKSEVLEYFKNLPAQPRREGPPPAPSTPKPR